MLDLFPEINESKAASLLWEIKRKNKLNDYNGFGKPIQNTP